MVTAVQTVATLARGCRKGAAEGGSGWGHKLTLGEDVKDNVDDGLSVKVHDVGLDKDVQQRVNGPEGHGPDGQELEGTALGGGRVVVRKLTKLHDETDRDDEEHDHAEDEEGPNSRRSL
jgi:hypothetical protein